jgi:hypothetical protein
MIHRQTSVEQLSQLDPDIRPFALIQFVIKKPILFRTSSRAMLGQKTIDAQQM